MTGVGDNAFAGCAALTEASLPEGLRRLGESAFADCAALEGLDIPESVTSIGGWAFCNCKSLESLTIPDGVTRIENTAFGSCAKLSEITLPESLTYIGWGAFSGCVSLSEITLPQSLTEIDNSAFADCAGLSGITIPDGVTSIGQNAFYGCDSLTELSLPAGLSAVEYGLFINCSSLTEIAIPEGVTSIGQYAFQGCAALERVTVPASVTEIGLCAFNGCGSLTGITIPEGVAGIRQSCFSECAALTRIEIPASVTSVEWYAFHGCEALSEVDYGGLRSQWLQVSVERDNAPLFSAAIRYGRYDITVDEDIQNGSVTPTVDGEAVFCAAPGETVVLAIEPDEGYELDELRVLLGEEEISVEDSSFTMPEAELSVRASFWTKRYPLRAVAEHGSVDFSTEEGATLAAAPGETVVLSLTPEAGYMLAELRVERGDGERLELSRPDDTRFSFTMPAEEVTVTARFADNIIDSGSWHELSWWLFDDGALAISGNAAMVSFNSGDGINAWRPYASFITSVRIDPGVTTVGAFAFAGCCNLTSVSLPEGLSQINLCAFYGCGSLTDIVLPENLGYLGYQAFAQSGLTAVTIPQNTTYMERDLLRLRQS